MGKLIVVADREPSFCKVMSQMLEKLGYETQVYYDGEEALNGFKVGRTDFFLLLIEATGFEFSGPKIYEDLQRIYPNLKVLFTSGYKLEHLQKYDKTLTKMNFLQKPFSFSELKEKIENLL